MSRAPAAEGAEDAEEGLDQPLPEPVRSRVVSLTAEALSRVATEHLPPSLRRAASFTPNRRARLAATQIASALEADPAFRERIATQVRVVLPEVAKALDEGTVPAAADPLELAAVAYLLRPDGWAAMVEAGSDQARASQQAASEAGVRQTLDRLHGQVAAARTEARHARDRYREQINALKAENSELRRRIADLRSKAKAADERAADAIDRSERDRTRAEAALSHAEAESRRMRARISELEAEATAARRVVRDGRDVGTMRSRLLLDTVLEAAAGLRRELALPTVDGSPADSVDAVVPPPASAPHSGRAQSTDDPGMLDELLALPRVHLVVDGYNVTKTAWPETPLESQRSRLLQGLGAIVARSGAEVTVVFDGADLTNPPPVNGPRGVRVRFSPPGVTADEVIRQLVAAEPVGRPVVVASSDREVAEAATRSGARSVDSMSLVRILART
jgi:predicted RNA-binding protein with PIN domain